MPVRYARTEPAVPALLSTLGTIAAGGGLLLLAPGGAFLSAGISLGGAIVAGAGGAALGRRLRGVHGRESFFLDETSARLENASGAVEVSLVPGTPLVLYREQVRGQSAFLVAIGRSDQRLAFATPMSEATVRSAPPDEASVLGAARTEPCPVPDKHRVRLPLSVWWRAHAITTRALAADAR